MGRRGRGRSRGKSSKYGSGYKAWGRRVHSRMRPMKIDRISKTSDC